MTAGSFLTYWYFHLPNFVLAALMYTLLGRAMLALFVDAELAELYLAFFLSDHRSGRCRRFCRNAESGGAGRRLVIRLRLAVLAACGAAPSLLVDGRSPAGELSRPWNAISTLSASLSSG